MSDRTDPSALQARLIAALWRLLSHARPITLWRLARRLGPLVYRFSARERKVTDINLREVYPQFDESRRAHLARLGRGHSARRTACSCASSPDEWRPCAGLSERVRVPRA